MPNVCTISATWIRLSEYTRSRTFLHISSSQASNGHPDLASFSKDVLPRLNFLPRIWTKRKMVQKTHKHRLTCRVFPCLFLLFKYKYRNTARYSTSDEKHAFAPLAMFDIQYLIKEWLDKRAIFYPGIKHVLKQCMKIVTAYVYRKWDRLVTYWLAPVKSV